MDDYIVTITYTTYYPDLQNPGTETIGTGNLIFVRKASSQANAISICSAVFDSLGNVRLPSINSKKLQLTSITATLVPSV